MHPTDPVKRIADKNSSVDSFICGVVRDRIKMVFDVYVPAGTGSIGPGTRKKGKEMSKCYDFFTAAEGA